MANAKISALPAGAPAQATDLVPVARSGANVSLQGSDIVTLAAATLVPQTTTVNGHALSSNVVVSASDLTTGSLGLAQGGTHADLSASGSATAILAQDASHVISARALVSGDIPNNAANTSGTAANLSGTPALPNGTTATTQAAFSNDTKLSTDAYADNNFKGVSITGFRDDFINCTGSSAVAGAESLAAGDTNWGAQPLVGTTATIGSQDATFSNPGQIIMTADNTSGHGVTLIKGGASARGTLGALGSNAGWEANFVLKLSQTTLCALRFGLFVKGAAANPYTDGMWVEYDTANASSSTDFTWVTASSSTINYSTANAIAADTNFHHFRIRSTTIGHILFSVDGGTETDISTDVSTALMLIGVEMISRTSATKAVVVDFISFMAATGRT